MKKSFLCLGVIIITIFSTVCSAESVKAKKVEKPQPQIDLMPYLEFAQEWTSHKYNGEKLPKIKIEKHDLVQVFAYGDLEYAQAESKGIALPVVNAIYLVDNKTIYISDSIDLKDPKLEITLVHEIVHYLQDISGYTKSLDGHLACTESEAYDVQVLWQTIRKVDTESIPYAYQHSLVAAMRCMGSNKSVFSKSSDQP